jgi:tetratricopeptide (TPR) repeat protein
MSGARTIWEAGNRLFDRGEVAAAIEAFERALRIDPGFPEALNSLGVAWYERKEYDRAITYLQQAVLAKPDFVEALNNLGACYLFRRRFNDASIAFEKVVALLPDFAEAYNNLGLVYEQLGDTAKATAAYRRFTELWKGNRRYLLAAQERIDRLGEGRISGLDEPDQVLDPPKEEEPISITTTTTHQGGEGPK